MNISKLLQYIATYLIVNTSLLKPFTEDSRSIVNNVPNFLKCVIINNIRLL